jgi:hypothetical protein
MGFPVKTAGQRARRRQWPRTRPIAGYPVTPQQNIDIAPNIE